MNHYKSYFNHYVWLWIITNNFWVIINHFWIFINITNHYEYFWNTYESYINHYVWLWIIMNHFFFWEMSADVIFGSLQQTDLSSNQVNTQTHRLTVHHELNIESVGFIDLSDSLISSFCRPVSQWFLQWSVSFSVSASSRW